MDKPRAQKHNGFEIVCGELHKEKESQRDGKSVYSLEAGNYGSKDGIGISIGQEDLMFSRVENNEVNQLGERKFKNGSKNKINSEIVDIKEVYKRQKRLGRIELEDERDIG